MLIKLCLSFVILFVFIFVFFEVLFLVLPLGFPSLDKQSTLLHVCHERLPFQQHQSRLHKEALLASLTSVGLFLARRFWWHRTGWLLILMLQSAGSGWTPALADLHVWWLGHQQHQSGTWNMVRNGAFKGCLEIPRLSFVYYTQQQLQRRVWELIIKY